MSHRALLGLVILSVATNLLLVGLIGGHFIKQGSNPPSPLGLGPKGCVAGGESDRASFNERARKGCFAGAQRLKKNRAKTAACNRIRDNDARRTHPKSVSNARVNGPISRSYPRHWRRCFALTQGRAASQGRAVLI
jgi:hypothetical protein